MANCRHFFACNFVELINEYEAGYIVEQHCDCPVCELYCEENDLYKCTDKSCDGCRNLASGKKIRIYEKELNKEPKEWNNS